MINSQIFAIIVIRLQTSDLRSERSEIVIVFLLGCLLLIISPAGSRLVEQSTPGTAGPDWLLPENYSALQSCGPERAREGEARHSVGG